MSLGLHREKIKLVPHDPTWASMYSEEEASLKDLLQAENLGSIHHIGSTSIPGIAAKPIMGVMLLAEDLAKARQWRPILETYGYLFREAGPDYLLFAKGPEDNRTIHLYVAEKGSKYSHTALIFRDYLNAHPEVAMEYEKLKLELAKKYPNDRKKYRTGKNKFIKKVISQAKADKNGDAS